VKQYLWATVLFLGIASIVLGATFIWNGLSYRAVITEQLRQEKVTLGIDPALVKLGEVVDTSEEALAAAGVLGQHLRDRYGTYAETKSGSPERATFLDGLTLQSSLNLAVLSFGVTTMLLGSGVSSVVTGLGLVGAGLALRRRESPSTGAGQAPK